MLKLSIIIPIYNKDQKLTKTVDSILNQTIGLDDMEIILVNDGSTDNSQSIINQYIDKYPNTIKSIIKDNGGLSDARNYGIKSAQGRYIVFIDAGDYIDINLFQNLETYMNSDIDLIKFKMIIANEEGQEIKKMGGPIFNTCTGEQAYEKLYTEDKYLDVACTYLYKRDFWMQNNFYYTLNTYHEDFGLTSIIILKANSVVSTNEYGYYYVQDNNSITRNSDYTKTVKRANDLLLHYDNMLQKLNSLNLSKMSEERIRLYYTNTVILGTENLAGQERKQYINQIKARKMINNIKPRNIKQFLKKMILTTNINLYLKLRR